MEGSAASLRSESRRVREKIYQGDYRFNEVSPAWYPQMVLANGSGLYESDAVILRVHPDGTGTLISTVNAVAETDFNMRRYPFDWQGLEAVHQSHCRRMRQEWKLRGR